VTIGENAANYWWDGDPTENFWVEIRKRPGTGLELRCPLLNKGGTRSGQYELLDVVGRGDVVYHWHATQARFVGRSRAAARVHIEGDQRVVPLTGFTPLAGDVALAEVRSRSEAIYRIRDRLEKMIGGATSYLPFQFRRDGLRMASYYFAKMPRDLVVLLFGESGMAEEGLEDPAPEDGPPGEPQVAPPTFSYLEPFVEKADAHYIVNVVQRRSKRGRRHETLVNACAKWFTGRKLSVRRNIAIDLAVGDPPIIVEAKMLPTKGFATEIRSAIGQLYEYRYFKIASPKAPLVLLASRPLSEQWVRYLEDDRRIGVMWPEAEGFRMSELAARSFGLAKS
jgi:hypothetical protein